MKEKNHYIDNKRLYQEFVIWKKQISEAKENNKPEPQMPDYIARAIIQIAERFGTKRNFAFLSHVEDMVGDAILTCVKYVKSFDPDKSNNPFSYITMILQNAFFQRAEKEKRFNTSKKISMEKFMMENHDDLHTNSAEYDFMKKNDDWHIDDIRFENEWKRRHPDSLISFDK